MAENWEYCELVVVKIGVLTSQRFRAVAGNGAVIVDEPVKNPNLFGSPPATRANIDQLQGICGRLIAEGWDPQPGGEAWHARRFRRVTPTR